MLHYLKGTVTMSFDGGVVVESGGVGYQVFVPDNSVLYQSQGKGPVLVYTVMILREDDVSLYGFAEKDSLELFRKLLTVNGVGAKAALAVLSAMPLEQVRRAIVFDDPDALTRANGIGKKTAQRIVLELKDKLGGAGELAGAAAEVESSDSKSEAAAALMGLGYSRSEALAALAGTEEGLTTEAYIKKALKNL
ncbi:MAG: Holliday junction branch migration protein RuvA [Bacillota bacterium]|nr:Holliday junction branch migration protein RuvA [Bacillota bacterium]